jgi:hypothetical protein
MMGIDVKLENLTKGALSMRTVIRCDQVFRSEEELRRTAIIPEGHKVVMVATKDKIVAFSDPMPANSARKRDVIEMRLAGARVSNTDGRAYVYP